MLKSRDSRSRFRHRRYCLSFLCIEKILLNFFLGFLLFAASGWGRCIWNIPIPKLRPKSSYATLRLCNKQGLSNDDIDQDESVKTKRRFVLIGRNPVHQIDKTDHTLTSDQNHLKACKECASVNDEAVQIDFNSEENRRISAVRSVKRRIPTPWPVNIIQERWNSKRESLSQTTLGEKSTGSLIDDGTSQDSAYPSMGALFFNYAKQQARIGLRQVSEISAQIWYNLPPSAPPLILLASIPRNVKVSKGMDVVAGTTSTYPLQRIIPLISDPFARSVLFVGLGMAVVSWSNQELQRKRKLTPLALSAMSNDQGIKGNGRVSGVFLPPFLPEDVPEPELNALLGTTVDKADLEDGEIHELTANGFEESVLSHVSPKIRRHLNGIYETTTTTSRRFFRNYYKDWLQGRAVRKREVAKIRRNRVFDELVALQALKKRQATSRKKLENKARVNLEPELGYALVTGASRGIGRAIAVELARWEIPLVLVARDIVKLTKLASDLESCYGVKCSILEADLSKPNAAERIHQATTDAGIPVDILINNAGLASDGLAVDTKTSFVERLVMLNSLTYAKLSVLYGRDMKKRRRGRILMVSSMAGLCNASPNTAIYGACKAFGKSLGLSMAKEMEGYGVGVTCLIPGAVSGTNFRTAGGTQKALCWYLPFYSRSPDVVAHQGVVSLLDGDTQSIPGWQNRVFANIVRPLIPQRLEIMLVQLAFSPLQIFSLKNLLRFNKKDIRKDEVGSLSTDDSTPDSSSSGGTSSWPYMKPRQDVKSPPRFLKLRDDDAKTVETKSIESNSGDHIDEEVCPQSPIPSGMNSTKGKISEVPELDKMTTHRSDTTLNMPNVSLPTETERTSCETGPQAIARHLDPNAEEYKEQRSSDAHNSDEENQAKNSRAPKFDRVKVGGIVTKTNDPSNQEDTKHYGDRSVIDSKHDDKKVTEKKRIERGQRPQWFGSTVDDDDDDIFSTRLGPLSIREQRGIAFPKQAEFQSNKNTDY